MPELRAAAWRVVFAALQHNPVMAARHAHLTGRAERPLADNQARIAGAAGLLRQLHAVIVTATPGTRPSPPVTATSTEPPLPPENRRR